MGKPIYEQMVEMCIKDRKCALDPMDCIYSLDCLFKGSDCNGPFTEEELGDKN